MVDISLMILKCSQIWIVIWFKLSVPLNFRRAQPLSLSGCSITFPTSRQMGEVWEKQHQMLFFQCCTKWPEAIIQSMWEDFSIHSLLRIKTWEMLRSVLKWVPVAQQVQNGLLTTTRSGVRLPGKTHYKKKTLQLKVSAKCINEDFTGIPADGTEIKREQVRAVT